MVRESTGTAAPAVRGRRRRSRCRRWARPSPRSTRRRRSWRRRRAPCWSASASAREDGGRFVDAYRRYCWPVRGARRPQARPLPPARHRRDRPRRQGPSLAHGDARRALRRGRPAPPPPPTRVVDTTDRDSEQAGTAWWTRADRARRRGHGRQAARLRRPRAARPGSAGAQDARPRVPAHHLRARVHRARQPRAARERGLGRKRSLASREFALGIEALERFVRGEPLRRVHECVFGVLALESEPVDPRL